MARASEPLSWIGHRLQLDAGADEVGLRPRILFDAEPGLDHSANDALGPRRARPTQRVVRREPSSSTRRGDQPGFDLGLRRGAVVEDRAASEHLASTFSFGHPGQTGVLQAYCVSVSWTPSMDTYRRPMDGTPRDDSGRLRVLRSAGSRVAGRTACEGDVASENSQLSIPVRSVGSIERKMSKYQRCPRAASASLDRRLQAVAAHPDGARARRSREAWPRKSAERDDGRVRLECPTSSVT